MSRVLPIIIIVSLLLAGCGLSGGIYANYHAVGDLRLVRTLGVDGDDRSVTLTAVVSAAAADEPPSVLRGSGGSIPAALDALQDRAREGLLYFAHAQFIVLGADYAARGIASLLDYVERDMHMRLGTALLLLREGSAADLLESACAAGADLNDDLSALRRAAEQRGDVRVGTFRETAVALSERGAALVCAIRTAADRGVSVVPAGYGVLRDGALAGFLPDGEAKAASMLRAPLGGVPVRVPDGAGGTVTLEVRGGAVSEAQWRADGTPGPLRVRANLTAAVAELSGDGTALSDPAAAERLSAALCARTCESLRDVLVRSQALDADFLGLGQALRLRNGTAFAALPDGWLQDLTFDVSAQAEIVHSHDLKDPVGVQGGGR